MPFGLMNVGATFCWPPIKCVLSKGGQNIVQPSRNSFIAKMFFLKPLEDLMPLSENLHCCFLSELRNSTKESMRNIVVKSPCLPFLHSEIKLYFYSFFPIIFLYFFLSSISRFIKSTLHSLKLLFKLY